MKSFLYYNKLDKILEYRKTAEILFSRHALKDKKLTIEDIDFELKETEGMDKVIPEYIAVFKRELTRRENELWHTRNERR